ncbi:MAG: DUF2281 domain-containing protein [Gemmatimonadales bacterium]|nr:DUF2281 domain-containing protein [Gemmatimonadales bacterium]
MNEHLKDRLLRKLDTLSDERAYQVLDFVEFLESKYAERSAPTNIFARITERVEDTMRAGKVPINAISGTVGVFDSASKVMKGLASAAGAVVDEASKTARELTQPPKAPPPADAAPPTAPPSGGQTG